jgi:hypothetical protein
LISSPAGDDFFSTAGFCILLTRFRLQRLRRQSKDERTKDGRWHAGCSEQRHGTDCATFPEEHGQRNSHQQEGGGEVMVRSSDYHRMLSRGRKAGLTARELNLSLALQPVVGNERSLAQADCNGFISGVDAQGHRIFTPIGEAPVVEERPARKTVENQVA